MVLIIIYFWCLFYFIFIVLCMKVQKFFKILNLMTIVMLSWPVLTSRCRHHTTTLRPESSSAPPGVFDGAPGFLMQGIQAAV